MKEKRLHNFGSQHNTFAHEKIRVLLVYNKLSELDSDQGWLTMEQEIQAALAGLIVLLLLICGGGAIFFMRGKAEELKVPQQEQAQVTSCFELCHGFVHHINALVRSWISAQLLQLSMIYKKDHTNWSPILQSLKSREHAHHNYVQKSVV